MPTTFGIRKGSMVIATLLCAVSCISAVEQPQKEIVIKPQEHSGPVRNPMMGFIGSPDGRHEYATVAREYVRWNDIETSAADTVQKLKEYVDRQWRGVEQRNIKIIPRVFLEWPKGSPQDPYWPIDSDWPSDMPRDFGSEQFKQRMVHMIQKMGEAWDNDPRIVFIESGMIGPWGEQHHPSPSGDIQRLMGDAFKAAFKHKLVMNRYPWEFKDYDFGIYWDSFGNPGWEMQKHVPELEGRLADRWKTAPMAGEVAFSLDPKSDMPRLGRDPTDLVANNADILIQYIRRWHWTSLGWVSGYDKNNPAAARGAARIQAAFGYRFVLDEARYPASVKPGGSLSVSLVVRNTGSAPMYYPWPVEVSLLDERTREPVWHANFTSVDVRTWLPGDFSDKGKGRSVGDKRHFRFEWDTGMNYDIEPQRYRVAEEFKLPDTLVKGTYVLALAILDPAGNLPSVRFAITNYFNGGRHPIGRISVDTTVANPELTDRDFDDIANDKSLHYIVEK